jgi:small GTP-binding protein
MIYKICTVGDPGCGRSVLLKLLQTEVYDPNTISTIGVDFKNFKMPNDDILQLWDISGQERYRSSTDQYFVDATAMIVAIDAQRLSTTEGAKYWLSKISHGEGITPIILVTKCDANGKREVSHEAVQQIAEDFKVSQIIEVSAKDRVNTDKFLGLVHKCVIAAKEATAGENAAATQQQVRPRATGLAAMFNFGRASTDDSGTHSKCTIS